MEEEAASSSQNLVEVEKPVDRSAGMESFNDPEEANAKLWEDPYRCCGCIPIKWGMYLMTVGSWVGLIAVFGQGW